ncbi:MAG: hypothetical protein GX556_03435 [Fibrobacter sp.]|nr:hypothetical protein [Fibrobacter sp.]
MIRTSNKIRSFLLLLCAAGLVMSSSAQDNSPDTSALQDMLDSLGLSKNDLEAKVRSTLLFGGSTPVSFSGEGRIKLQYHQFLDNPQYLEQDQSYIQSNWEGNESFLRLGMVARAGRNTVLWSKIGFQHTLPGNYHPPKATGDTIAATRHDKAGESAIVHEDMSAGLAIRTVPVSFMLKLGAVHWVEASPLTIWKSQPRTFAWEYLPFEVEQPIARYFEYNIAKGEKSGRAAWNKKAFQGINLESINLPGDLYFNFLWGSYERYDNFEREYIDYSGDVAYADLGTSAKGKGIGDTYRKVFHARLAAIELFGRMTPGLNFMGYNYDNDIFNNDVVFKNVFGYSLNSPGSKGFIKEPIVSSIDLRGPITDNLNIHADLAMSFNDTLWRSVDTINGKTQVDEKRNWDPFNPALYARIESKYGLPINADLAFISNDFYSPLSFAAPTDAFFPFSANLLGPGKFIGRGEASPYAKNMAGINLQVVPEIAGYGHLKFSYGQHFQIQAARDLVYFPYRLNGQDMFSFFHSSYNRWGNELIDHSLTGKYTKRLGDESFQTSAYQNPVGFEGGGMRSDYLAMYEGFVPYENADQARANLNSKGDLYYQSTTGDEFSYAKPITDDTGAVLRYDTLTDNDAFVPHHRKFTFNFDVDYAYDLGPLLGYPRDLFFSIYYALNGVSTSFKPLAFSDEADEMLLWGTYLRMEPAIAVTPKFYVLGLVGFENWKSQKAYTAAGTKDVKLCPIDYRDYAFGVGFDWDVLARVGFHGRFKYMMHDDIHLPANNYKTPVVSTEIKMWF